MTTAEITFVTVSKGRLAHLRQSLPHLARQNGAHTIIVDMNCPDGTADWVTAEHPQAEILRLNEAAFNISRARNFGLAAANTPWVCFIDADVIVEADFWRTVQPSLLRDHYHLFDTRKGLTITGSVIVETAHALSAGGYDDAMKGWGGEDLEFYSCLEEVGCKRRTLNSDAIHGLIQHATSLRTQFYDIKNMRVSHTINTLYRAIKSQVRRTNPQQEINQAIREKLYSLARTAVQTASDSSGRTVRFEFDIPADPSVTFLDAKLEQRLSFRLSLTKS